MKLTCFKAYDVRGQMPEQINPEVANRIGRAYAQVFNPGEVVVGYDIRLSSPALCRELIAGLRAEGVDVIDIGCCGTEEVYFATTHLNADGGIIVTASHNPKDYNGMKFVREQARPIHAENGLQDIRAVAEQLDMASAAAHQGDYRTVDTRPAYIDHLLSYINVEAVKPLKVVANPGNGGAGLVMEKLLPHLPIECVMVHGEPDGHFPNGVPNPLLPENRSVTRETVLNTGADLGIAWDGDFDRCFFFDERGEFIEGYYLVGLFAEFFLEQNSDDVVVHDPRLYWNTQAVAHQFGSQAIQSKTGHAYMKAVMREHNAVYGGEMSAHHYFRDFSYCDSGMIPWLLIIAQISKTGKKLSQLVAECQQAYPVSGEINTRLQDPDRALSAIEAYFAAFEPLRVDKTDGISMDFSEWRFNLRKSNTEPVVRLNVESRRDPSLMAAQRDLILELLQDY